MTNLEIDLSAQPVMDTRSEASSRFSENLPPLNHGAIHVWIFRVSDADENAALFHNLLNPEERARADRFRFEPSRNSYIGTRGRLRIFLGKYLGIAPREIEFTVNDHGKPRLAGLAESRGLVFNVSHSGDTGVLAFGMDIPLGVDIEEIKPRQDLEGLARFCLSTWEETGWRRYPEEYRHKAFTRYWVAKEAFVKAVGRGIGLGIRKVMINPEFDGYHEIPEGYGPAAGWQLREWGHGSYRIALAYSGAEKQIHFR